MLAVLGAIALTGGDDDTGPVASSSSPDPGVAHVHGLDVNPADGSLFVATAGRPPTAPGSWCCPGTRRRGAVGADQAGAVWQRDADAWSQVSKLPGGPQAFLATAQALYVAAGDHDTERTGIYASDDGGRTWEQRYRDPES